MRFVTSLVAAFVVMLCTASVSASEPTERDVAFQQGATRLAGTLFLPANRSRVPAMAMMPGSGPETRAPLISLGREFATRGMATLVYDKQGTGQSGGDWTRESLDDLAADGLAALAFLRNQPGIDPHKVGAWGISQSGWVMPLLAKKDSGLAFMICVTGGGATPREVEYYGYRAAMSHAGFGESDWISARGLIDKYMDYLASGQGREALSDAIAHAENERWSSAINLKRVLPRSEDVSRWAWVATYDPQADIRSLRMPVLVLIGGMDPFTPASVSIQRWQEGLEGGDPRDIVVSFPSAGHGLRINGHDMKSPPQYAPGYVDSQLTWLHTLGVL